MAVATLVGCESLDVPSSEQITTQCIPAPLPLDDVTSGTLSTTSCEAYGTPEDRYRLTFPTATVVGVTLASPDFSHAVTIGDLSNGLAAGTEAPKGFQTPSILFLGGAGTHDVAVSGGLGQYTLTVTQNPPIAGCTSIYVPAGTAATMTLPVGGCRTPLTGATGTFNNQSFYVLYDAPGFAITVTSAAFSPVVVFPGTSSTFPSASGSVATLIYQASGPGTMLVRVTGRDSLAAGAYTIDIGQ